MTDENPFVKDNLTDTELLVRQLEYLTGHKVHISDDPAPHLVKVREAIKRESKQLHTVLTEIRDDLMRHGENPESLAAAVTRLGKLNPSTCNSSRGVTTATRGRAWETSTS